jgi:hypothetical protein
MHGLPQVHYRPRTGASYEAPTDVLVPALMRLRHCTDSLKTLVVLDTLPDIILPALALTASQKTYVPPIAVRTIVKYCGPAFLERTLGKPQARALRARYAEREAISGVA